MKEFIINQNDAGQRLDRFVGKAAPLLPSSLMQKYIRIKRIKINNKSAARDTKLVYGDTIQMYVNDEFFEAPTEKNSYLKITSPDLNILFEDENILLVDKKPGVLCHDADGASAFTLIAHIKAYLYQKKEWRPFEENTFTPALCNRIDRNTGGIVIAAKNAETLRIINEKIKNQEIDKHYLAIVHGTPSPPDGTLRSFLFKDAAKNQVIVKKTSEKGTKTAITEYRTLMSFGNLSLVECRLLTGRTHQIRAQFADFGHPLLGDGKYGSERLNRPYSEHKQALYSYRLMFSFTSDAGMLNYLKNREFIVFSVDFVGKYFSGYKIH